MPDCDFIEMRSNFDVIWLWRFTSTDRYCTNQSWAVGTRQFCRDNVTMLSGNKVVCNFYFTIFIVATPSRHWGLTIFRFFSSPWLVPEAILRCREAKKLSRAQLWYLYIYGPAVKYSTCHALYCTTVHIHSNRLYENHTAPLSCSLSLEEKSTC